ncbi:hypothetical protein KBC04_01985 [Candidatus Babeliales bacterium]|nr:hypothetical protein [Candidatus Babeliales bacterium]MBP9843821.1 hypothetical protein [Candidatus Babeliales bacterium]
MCAENRNYKKEIQNNVGCATAHDSENQTMWQAFYHELLHHFPYATLSVALALMLLTLINVFFNTGIAQATMAACHDGCCHTSGLDILFHSFHFIHILFATSGTIVTFRRYSDKVFVGLLVGTLSSMVFCTLSDVLLPYAAGRFLGIEMDLHICFASELSNILPFLFVGLLNGWVMTQLPEFRTQENSLFLHFLHTFISAMASIFYAVGHGLSDFYMYFGMFYLLMVVAVIIPCTLSDVIAPIFFAKFINKQKNSCKAQ